MTRHALGCSDRRVRARPLDRMGAKMHTTRHAVIGSLVLALVLLGCGDSEDSADDAGGNGAAAAFCERLNALEAEFAEETAVPTDDQLEQVADELRQLDPPSEIAGDFQELLEAYDVLAQVELGDPEAIADLEEQLEGFEAAGQRIDDWTDENCGPDDVGDDLIDPDGD